MPGPVSDSYDPEWGNAQNKRDIENELREEYNIISENLQNAEPIYILDLINDEKNKNLTAKEYLFSEYELRLIRFALERAMESL